MRKSFPVLIPAGKTWPESQPDSPTLAPFNWIRIHNRATTAPGTADCVFDFDTRPLNDPVMWFDIAPTGRRVVRNMGSEKDPMKTELHILNVGTQPAPLWVEVSDHPIVDINDANQAGSSATLPLTADADAMPNYTGGVETVSHQYVFNANGWFRQYTIGSRNDGDSGAGSASVGALVFNGATYDRVRSVSGAGDGVGVLQAMQPSSDNPPAAAVSVANTQVQLIFAAVAGQTHRLTYLVASYAGGAIAGRLTVNDNTNNIVDLDVVAAGPIPLPPMPPGGLSGRVGAGVTITLTAGGVGVVGKISAAKLTA